ncbi:50S ribosomal protein L25/general stress protein Ctc [Allostreptomyces psammosilenae]|uniref:Large ribosomal subunit protein bL25 n=1 Tax=Allostreptomyces psammosilenae TaxID=1892865 RepID=A0A852ZVL7_9ACTN|nr:50S ribosomal protein L25/general stress protein Ctc [Allostreptomyces psammosilenae]NYI05985.1 large subunit ribosomal protein L25 [Allostreptomyces psammosilenae]
MSEVRIAAEPRSEFGKGAARRARRAGKVPAVLYGHGNAPLHLNLPGHELMMALKTPNVLLSLEVDGQRKLALPKAVQRDVLKGFLEHVDLLLVQRGEKVTVEVPLVIEGEPAPGGNLVEHLQSTISVEAEATHVPETLAVSVEGLSAGAAVHAGDVELPAGVTLVTGPETGLVQIVLPQVEAAPAEAEAAEAEAPAEG